MLHESDASKQDMYDDAKIFRKEYPGRFNNNNEVAADYA
jgi:hypothetical protein